MYPHDLHHVVWVRLAGPLLAVDHDGAGEVQKRLVCELDEARHAARDREFALSCASEKAAQVRRADNKLRVALFNRFPMYIFLKRYSEKETFVEKRTR